MLRASYTRYLLGFKTPAGTSRGILTNKETFFIKLWEEEEPDRCGIGECALFRGLSAEDMPGYEKKLKEVCMNIESYRTMPLRCWSSIRFGLEMALADLRHGGKRLYFPSPFYEGKAGIEINGLIWMGDQATMQQRIREKLEAGFHCIKLKIGAIDFDAELSLLKSIRQKFGPQDVELRVDANGAFLPAVVFSRLEALAPYHLHSIEQPIRQGQWKEMARVCALSPIPVALDEELIGADDVAGKEALLQAIRPQYIILKPALTGGFSGAEEWIRLAREARVEWWVTSALESDIGLNALAQWASGLGNPMPQGLGTGQLYTNNITSPLVQVGERLWYDPAKAWENMDFLFK